MSTQLKPNWAHTLRKKLYHKYEDEKARQIYGMLCCRTLFKLMRHEYSVDILAETPMNNGMYKR